MSQKSDCQNKIKYIILEQEIGYGGYASVKKCINSQDKKVYAVKTLNKKLQKQQNKLQQHQNQIENEIFIHKKVSNKNSHKNIIQLHDIIKGKDNTKQLILEFAQKGTLLDYLQTQQNFNPNYLRYAFYEIMLGLQHIHKNGIYHRDIKPDNILLDQNLTPKICDFGLSILQHQITQGNAGTKVYQAPEIYLDQQILDGEKLDVFSAGVTLFSIMSGSFPFKVKALKSDLYYKLFLENNAKFWLSYIVLSQSNQQKLKVFIDPDFQDLINQMLCYDPQQRITVQGVLNHRFFQKYRISDITPQNNQQNTSYDDLLVKKRVLEYFKNTPFAQILIFAQQSNIEISKNQSIDDLIIKFVDYFKKQ